MKPIRVKDVMTDDELEEFEELNYAVLTSATKMERNFYNKEIENLIQKAKDRYFRKKWKRRINVSYEQDEDGYFIATCSDFDGCYSQGKTLLEATENIREAIELCLEGLVENEREI